MDFDPKKSKNFFHFILSAKNFLDAHDAQRIFGTDLLTLVFSK